MQEKLIEQKLVKEVKKLDGLCPKFISPGFAGMPDRIVLLPKGKMAFVEVKSKGLNPRPLQISRHKLLRRLGFKVYILDDEKEIQIIIQSIIGGDAR